MGTYPTWSISLSLCHAGPVFAFLPNKTTSLKSLPFDISGAVFYRCYF